MTEERVWASKSFIRFFKDANVITAGRFPGSRMEAGIVKLNNGYYQVLVLRDDATRVTNWNLIYQTRSHNKAQDTLQTVDNVLMVVHGMCYSVWDSHDKKWMYEDEIIQPREDNVKPDEIVGIS